MIRYSEYYKRLGKYIDEFGKNDSKTKEIAKLVLENARLKIEFIKQFKLTKLPNLTKTTPYMVLNDPRTIKILNQLSMPKKNIFYYLNKKDKFLQYNGKFILVSRKPVQTHVTLFFYNPMYADGKEIQSWTTIFPFHSDMDLKRDRIGYYDNMGSIGLLERTLMKEGYGILVSENEILMYGQFDRTIGPGKNLMRMEVKREERKTGIVTLIKGFPATMTEMRQEAESIADYVLKRVIMAPKEAFEHDRFKNQKPVLW